MFQRRVAWLIVSLYILCMFLNLGCVVISNIVENCGRGPQFKVNPVYLLMQLRKPQKLQYCAQGFKKIICNRHCSLSVMVFGVFMIKFQPSDCICMQFSVISRITTMTTIDCAAIVVVVYNLKPIICIDMFWSNVCFFLVI